jgi:16S rRNA (cytidine1402-2'-O)-methyltransferase
MDVEKTTGHLYLIPTPLVPESTIGISEELIREISGIQLFFAEKAKTARHFLKKVHPSDIKDLEVIELDKRDPEFGLDEMIKKILSGKNAGLMSEAGSPAIADPGNMLVRKAHAENIRVIPLIGPNSLLLALMASGLNGQHFEFVGYLPRKAPKLQKAILALEKKALHQQSSILFIETPYRNEALIESLIQFLKGSTNLCIAANITAQDEWIRTMRIDDWKKMKRPDLNKVPAIFIIG